MIRDRTIRYYVEDVYGRPILVGTLPPLDGIENHERVRAMFTDEEWRRVYRVFITSVGYLPGTPLNRSELVICSLT